MAQRQAQELDRPPTTTSTKQEFMFWLDTLGVRVCSYRGVSKIYRTQGVFNRFNGLRARLNQVNSTVF